MSRSSTSSSDRASSRLGRAALWAVALLLPALGLAITQSPSLGTLRQPKVPWIERTLAIRGATLRLAAIGSSRTWDAFVARRVSRALYGDETSAVNLGLALPRVDRDYVLVRALLAQTRVSTVVLEVPTEGAGRVSEDLVGLLPLGELLGDAAYSPLAAASWPTFRDRADLLVGSLLGRLLRPYAEALDALAPSRDALDAPTAWDESAGWRAETGRLQRLPPSSRVELPPPRVLAYLERVARLCRDRGVELVFLFVPAAGATLAAPYRDWLARRGRVYELEPAALERPELFADADHLNASGAELLTDAFAARRRAEARPAAAPRAR